MAEKKEEQQIKSLYDESSATGDLRKAATIGAIYTTTEQQTAQSVQKATDNMYANMDEWNLETVAGALKEYFKSAVGAADAAAKMDPKDPYVSSLSQYAKDKSVQAGILKAKVERWNGVRIDRDEHQDYAVKVNAETYKKANDQRQAGKKARDEANTKSVKDIDAIGKVEKKDA
jgi:hypothetical protein